MTLRAVMPTDRSTGLRANVVQVDARSRGAAGMAPGRLDLAYETRG